MSRQVSVVAHTHWDREWYLSHEAYVARLLRIFPSIIESLRAGQINHFLFDGQTAALEDLLAHCEGDIADAAVSLINAGRISIGPWYVMPDEFLCCGEALVRNLQEGIRVSRHYGERDFVGYLPDTFGHVAQMPQIFKGFQIHTAVVWRGVDIEGDLFEWRPLHGDGVDCLFLPEGYYQQPLSKVDYVDAATCCLDRLVDKADHSPLLLMQGGDHLVPPANLKDRIADFNAAQSRYHMRLTTLPEHMKTRCSQAAYPRVRLTGELRSNTNAFVLPDVLSTRRYLKGLNQAAEDRLLGHVEPLLAAADLGAQYPTRYLRETWKLLLQQHAHDSICGCSTDTVHQEMMVRFRRIQERLDALQTLVCDQLGLQGAYLNCPATPSPFADDTWMTAFNPSMQSRSGWHPMHVFLAGEQAQGLKITDESGQPCEAIACDVEAHRKFASPVDDFPEHVHGHRYALFVRLAMDGWQSKVLHVAKGTAPSMCPLAVPSPEASMISSDRLSIRAVDSGVEIEDSRSKDMIASAIMIVSEGDAGDSYNYSPPPEPWRVKAEVSGTRVWQLGEHGHELEVLLRLRQPQSLHAERNRASHEHVVSHGVLRLRLLDGEPFVRASLGWTNNAKDHRLRLVFALGEKLTHTVSDSAFALIERPVALQEARASGLKSEARVSVNPSHSFIRAGKLGVAHLALQEYEILDDGHVDMLALTLIRSVGWLSRRDLVTRGAGAGPDIETPEAQCLGDHQYDLIFSVGGHDRLSLREADEFRRPLLFLNGSGCVTDTPLSVRADELMITACRRLGKEVEVRMFNPTAKPQTAEFSTRAVRRVSLAGEDVDNRIDAIAPGEIATFRIQR
ncbi:MAG: glycoside hydrolase family 38 [Gammaproteobacteria bacterium]|nr:glycoside hydrolase family 38 [Gammaproteobacteria bacterium]MCY4323778.1 glycoside hydrolase family 38 [Gammaproteobacteria bacterium]